ncbi:hypothetical protein GCM10010387_29850 [Streptomyces inusitatus]|uniref:Uncharacterized protein n=1 Tax=Streptomyces inusitatus TaxID=68221 RepID=A0A918Q4F9_9ACTN|nr:hypothetical protein [Streptomyces inusitatus]GGZ33689.1 hypothetical protein GCM10010387_29850 [Streptomyces inusitatus]
MSPGPHRPPLSSALRHPATAEGHRRLVARRTSWLIAVVLLGAGAGWCATVQTPSQLPGFLVILAVCYPPCLFVTGLALRRTRRMARILALYPWQAYPCTYPRRSVESPKAIVIEFSEAYTPVLRLALHSGDLAKKQNPSPDLIWFAGDPRYGGVISPVGGHFPVRVVPEPPGGGAPGGGTAADVLAERAELVKGGRVRRT